MNNCDLYITGVSPKTEWEGTIVYRLYEKGAITKHVEPYFKHPEKEGCISTTRFFIPVQYLFNFIALNSEIDDERKFELKEILIDNLNEPDNSPIEPLGGNFG